MELSKAISVLMHTRASNGLYQAQAHAACSCWVIVKIDLPEVNDHRFSCDCWRPKGARMFRALGKNKHYVEELRT